MSRADDIFQKLQEDGEAAIDQFIADFQSENLWLDFKRSADDGAGTKLHIRDRENLSRAISGFGNSDGGVIVWGVDCRRDPATGADVPHDKVMISNPQRFVSWLENVITSCTAPPHPAVEHIAFALPGSSKGFVATLISSSIHAPHQCIQPTFDARYYMRVGANFGVVPHAVLSGLFGRRPQPRLALKWFASSLQRNGDAVTLAATITLTNTGRSIARDLYLNLYAYPPGENCRVAFGQFSDRWESYQLSNMWQLISEEGFRLAPGANAPVGVFQLILRPPFTSNYVFEVSHGCEGAERRQSRTDIPPPDFSRIYTDALEVPTSAENIYRRILME
ncbi:MAG: hypothetical protein QOK37_2661 [Thermoanaerobaculia bacterium]|nr:hypothetical protein [Thermoanaerobaculia bacterium]